MTQLIKLSVNLVEFERLVMFFMILLLWCLQILHVDCNKIVPENETCNF